MALINTTKSPSRMHTREVFRKCFPLLQVTDGSSSTPIIDCMDEVERVLRSPLRVGAVVNDVKMTDGDDDDDMALVVGAYRIVATSAVGAVNDVKMTDGDYDNDDYIMALVCADNRMIVLAASAVGAVNNVNTIDGDDDDDDNKMALMCADRVIVATSAGNKIPKEISTETEVNDEEFCREQDAEGDK